MRRALRVRTWAAALAVLMTGIGVGAEPLNERPMFEGGIKTPAMQEADAAFIAGVEQHGGSRSAGAQRMVASGWRFWRSGDRATAMRRFNQAWLLDAANPGAYHGMAVVRATQNATPAEIERLFRLALAQAHDDAAARVDYGFFLIREGRLDEAMEQLHAALKVDATARNARSHIAFVHYLKADRASACRWARVAQKNGDRLEQGFENDMCGNTR